MNGIKRLIAAMFYSMLIISIIDTSKGIYIPSFKEVFSTGDVGIGWYLLTSSLFYVIGTYISGYIIQKKGRAFTLRISALSTVIGLIIIALFSSGLTFYLSSVFINLGISAVAMCVNTLISSLDIKNNAVLMNMIHFTFGAGATITHKGGGILMKYGLGFRSVYFILIFFVMMIFFIGLKMNIPDGKEKTEDNLPAKYNRGEKKIILIISLALGFYVSAELQTASWIINYITNTFNISENAASTYSASFFLIFSFGRLFGGFVAEKIGYIRSVTISCLIASIMYITGLAFGKIGLILIAVSGLFFSIVFPTVVLSLKIYFKNSINKSSGIVISVSAMINMFVSLIMGYLAEGIGIEKSMYVIPVFLILSALLLIFLGKEGENLLKTSN